MVATTRWKICQTLVPAFVFLSCFIIYISNCRTIAAGDTVPNSLLAFNWLKYHTFNLDVFRDSYFYQIFNGTPYFFVEASNGHLTSVYPVGVAIVTLPIYVVFFLYLKLLAIVESNSSILDISSSSFEVYRLGFEKLAAVFVSALSATIFYLSVRLKFSPATALITTFTYSFSTNLWLTSSQALWQHGATNLVTVSIILGILKANRTTGNHQRTLLLCVGFFCGLLPGIRVTNILFLIAILVYATFIYRRQIIFLAFGLTSISLSAIWNFYYFGDWLGGYTILAQSAGIPLYEFTLKQWLTSFLGILISPSRGLLIFSPVVVYAIPGTYQTWKLKSNKDEKLIICLMFAALGLFLNYCFYKIWWAGGSYGPRFLTDSLPVLCYTLAYFIDSQITQLYKQINRIGFLGLSTFFVLMILSTFPQVVGAFGTAQWDAAPIPADLAPSRLWDFRDSQITRQTASVFFKLTQPIKNNAQYIQNLSGLVKTVKLKETNGQPIPDHSIIEPSTLILIEATLVNTGQSQWLGYETGLTVGESRVRVRFLNEFRQQVLESRLYISRTSIHDKTAQAVGFVPIPRQSGSYKIVFDLIIEGIGEFPGNLKPPFEIPIVVGSKNP